jgi:hypothetical protein
MTEGEENAGSLQGASNSPEPGRWLMRLQPRVAQLEARPLGRGQRSGLRSRPSCRVPHPSDWVPVPFKAPQLLPGRHRHVSSPLRAFVLMEMITPANWLPAMPRTRAAETPRGRRTSRHVPPGIRRPESRLTGVGVGLHRVPTKSRPPADMVSGFRHVFVLVMMTDHATGPARMWQRSPTRAPLLAYKVGARLATRLACPPWGPSPVHEERTDRDRRRASRGTGLDLRLRRLPNFSPAITDTARGPFRALVLVEMITPGNCCPATPRMLAAETPPPAPEPTLRSLEDLERAGPGAAGVGQARNSIARPRSHSQDPQAGARCDPGAGPLAGFTANPVARSSSGGSSPLVRPAHARRGVAG